MLAFIQSFHIGQDGGGACIDEDLFPLKQDFLFVMGNLYGVVGHKGCPTVVQRDVWVAFQMLVVLVPQE